MPKKSLVALLSVVLVIAGALIEVGSAATVNTKPLTTTKSKSQKVS
jgi:hypothetical protein